MESQVGILEYIQTGKEFSAVLNGLYSNFQVHEINMDGKIILLTTLNQLILDQINDRRLSIFMEEKDKGVNAEEPVQLHAQFSLCKENQTVKEAMVVLSKIAKESTLRLPSLLVAGPPIEIREITSQLVTVTDHLVPLQSESVLKPQHKETFGRLWVTDDPLGHGVRKVNSFSIVLSNIIGDQNFIEMNLKSLKAIGFINYYGTQCFGTGAHLVGKQLLLNQWKPAIDLISEEFQTHQKCHPKEHQLCFSVEKDAKDLVDASNAIPFSMGQKYIHAYQSFIWNTVVSKRIAKFGTTPIVGDLVHAPWTVKDRYDFDEGDVSTSSNEADRMRCQLVVVDTNNIHNYTIEDIVLPLPCYNITYPVNEIAGWYRTLLKADGLTEMDFKKKTKKYNLNKTYRRLVSKPSDLNWKFVLANNSSQRSVPPGLDPMGKTEFLNIAVEGSSEPNREYPEEQFKPSQVSASAMKNSSTFMSMPSASAKRKSSVQPVGSDVKYEDDVKPMTYEEKKQLSLNIQLLPSDKLARVVHIFRSLEPADGFKQVDGPYPEETVIDLDRIKPSTIRILESYLASIPNAKLREMSERKVPEKGKKKWELTDTLRENLKRESLSTVDAKEDADDRIDVPSNSIADGDSVLVVEFKIPASSDAAVVLREIMKMDVSAMFDGQSGINPAEVSESPKEFRKKGFRLDHQIVSEFISVSDSPEKLKRKRLKLSASQ